MFSTLMNVFKRGEIELSHEGRNQSWIENGSLELLIVLRNLQTKRGQTYSVIISVRWGSTTQHIYSKRRIFIVDNIYTNNNIGDNLAAHKAGLVKETFMLDMHQKFFAYL